MTGSGSGEPVLEMTRVTHDYPEHPGAVQDVSLTLRQGECVAWIGRNGAGKSTLALLASGLLRPMKGSVRIFGQETRRKGRVRPAPGVACAFQNPDLQLLRETVREEVAWAPWGRPGPPAARVEELLALAGLADRAGDSPFSLGRVQRRRLALCALLAAEPRLLVVDEITAGHDALESHGTMAMLRGWREAGGTLILVTHDLRLAAEEARRTVLFDAGRVILDGPTREVLGQAEALRAAGMRPPQATRIGQRLGLRETVLTPAEVAQEVRNGGRAPG